MVGLQGAKDKIGDYLSAFSEKQIKILLILVWMMIIPQI